MSILQDVCVSKNIFRTYGRFKKTSGRDGLCGYTYGLMPYARTHLFKKKKETQKTYTFLSCNKLEKNPRKIISVHDNSADTAVRVSDTVCF